MNRFCSWWTTALPQPTIILHTLGKHDEAEPLYKISQEIFPKSVRRDHPNFAAVLNKRVLLSICSSANLDPTFTQIRLRCPVHYVVHFEGKDAEAQPLRERCQEILEKALGPEHPSLTITGISSSAYDSPDHTYYVVLSPHTSGQVCRGGPSILSSYGDLEDSFRSGAPERGRSTQQPGDVFDQAGDGRHNLWKTFLLG